jgi:hypothetical protein
VTPICGQSDEVTLAVLGSQLKDVREDIRGMRADLASHRAELVPRGEWEQRNHHVDGRFQEHGREIATLRTALETKVSALDSKIAAVETKADNRRAPWWSVAALVVSASFLFIALIPLINAKP